MQTHRPWKREGSERKRREEGVANTEEQRREEKRREEKRREEKKKEKQG